MRMLLDALRRRPEVVLLTALALVTRLWTITDPPVVVWDEHHYTYFMGAYLSHTYIVDVHPPLGRLILSGAASLFGYNGTALWERSAAPLVRIVPALFGALLVPVVYALGRAVGGSRPVAALVAAALLFDSALLVESRFALPDSALLLAVFTAVLCDVTSDQAGRRRWIWMLAAALAAGAAVSIKWTGLSALGVIGARRLLQLVDRERSLVAVLRDFGAVVAVVAALYVGSFWLNFAILTDSGPGDAWMGPAFTKTLEGSLNHVHGARVPFWQAFGDAHKAIADMNVAIGKVESAPASPWYTWPIAKHSIVLWAPNGSAAPTQRWIVMFGNPVVWFGAIAGMLAALFVAARGRVAEPATRRSLLLLAAGYLINFAPFALIHRPMYLYHYLMPLVFSLLIAGVGVGPLLGWGTANASTWGFRSRRGAAAYWGIAGMMAATFLYLSPMVYGRELSATGVKHRLWVIERRP